jgi:hypothetical protein
LAARVKTMKDSTSSNADLSASIVSTCKRVYRPAVGELDVLRD